MSVKPFKSLSTVNVIEMRNVYTVVSLVSFPDTPAGNNEAERLFIKKIKETTDLDDDQTEQ